MSYDVAVCTPPIPADDVEAWEELERLTSEEGEIPPILLKFYQLLTSRYPCLCSLPDEKMDEEGAWSYGPLMDCFGHRSAVLSMSFSWVNEVVPFIIRTANSLDLIVLDMSGETICRP